jgi:serine/threonine-protein kinase
MNIKPGNSVGRYTVVNQLGQGGMSTVFLAKDTQEDRDVVLKFPNQDLLGDVASHERFRREVKIGQLLKHPNIQMLHELAYEGNNEFIVLEYVDGDSMRQVLRDRKSGHNDDVQAAVDYGIQIGGALSYAHLHHVAHRDLKPENVIVTHDGRAKVMDFGIALLQGARRVTWGPLSTQVGTPDYMSPEQIQGGRGDARSDIYALGMILYELIAHRLPYHGDNALAVMNQHVNMKAPPLHKFRDDAPPALEEIIMKAIRLKPQDRWPTMDAMVDALKDWNSVDVAALRKERETEQGGGSTAQAMGKLPILVNPVTLMVGLYVILLIVVVVALFVIFGHHAHVH